MRFKKYLKTSVLVIIFLLSLPKVKADWWSSSWNYKKELTIIENSGNDLINYPVVFWFNHEGNVNADCSDIRVVNDTSGNVLKYGQRNCNTTHVELTFQPNLTASGDTTDYYVYYGNSGALFSNSTWEDMRYNIYDDFNDGTINPHWKVSYAPNGNDFSESGGTMHHGPDYHTDMYYNTTQFQNLKLTFDFKSSTGSNSGGVFYRKNDTSGRDSYWLRWVNDNPEVDKLDWLDSGGNYNNVWTYQTGAAEGQWNSLMVIAYENQHNVLLSDGTWKNTTQSKWNTKGYIGLYGIDGGMEQWWDNLRVRKYTDPEPIISVGSEETPNQPPTYSNFNIENPSTYDSNTKTNISIDWSDVDGNFEYSILETNITGSPVNETGNVTSKSIVLGAGIFYAKFHGNDTQGAWNSTNRKIFTINKALASLLINKNTTSPITYPESVKTIGSNCPSQLICSLYRNNSPVSNPDEVLLGAGNYKWTFNTSGNKNYTQDEVITKLAINKGIPSLSILFNKTSPIIYPTPLKTTAFERNQGDSDLTYILERNGTLIERGSNVSDEVLLKPGVYNYTYYTKGGNNWTSGKTEQILVVKEGEEVGKKKINFLEKSLTSGKYIIKIFRKIGEEIKKIFTPEKIGLEKRTPNYSIKAYTYNNLTVKKLERKGIELEIKESSNKREVNFKCPEGVYVKKIIKGNVKEEVKGNSRQVKSKFTRAMNILKEKLSKLE